jgi:predicted peptidase
LLRPTRLLLPVLLLLAIVFGVRHLLQPGLAAPDWIAAEVNGMAYDVRLPAAPVPGRRYPVVLYLHQLAMGTDRATLHTQIDPWFDSAAFARHPAIVVVPRLDQSHDPGGRLVNFGGKRTGGADEVNAIDALRAVVTRFPADLTRIYVTGNSMGGMGTWDMMLSYNAWTGTRGRIFAAGLPLAGAHRTADPDDAAARLRGVPIWAIHGARDPEVSLDWDRAMAKRLQGQPNFRYTEDPALAHDVWDTWYRRPEVWDWLFAQRAPAPAHFPSG